MWKFWTFSLGTKKGWKGEKRGKRLAESNLVQRKIYRHNIIYIIHLKVYPWLSSFIWKNKSECIKTRIKSCTCFAILQWRLKGFKKLVGNLEEKCSLVWCCRHIVCVSECCRCGDCFFIFIKWGIAKLKYGFPLYFYTKRLFWEGSVWSASNGLDWIWLDFKNITLLF